MKNLKLASFINLIILCAGIFIASLIGFSLVRLNLAVKILFALIIALLVTFFAYKKESAVSVRVKNSQNSIKRINEVMHILNTCAGDEIQSIFLKFFNLKGICAKAHKRYMCTDRGYTVFLGFYTEPLGEFDAKNILENLPFADAKLVIISNQFTDACVEFCKFKQITLITSQQIAPYLDYDVLNLRQAEKSVNKNKRSLLKALIKSFYNRKNFKRFFLYGVLLFTLSRLTFYPVYYVISGGIFIVNGLIALLFGKNDLQAINQSDWFFDNLNNAQNKNAT